jgi:hypothetical protein
MVILFLSKHEILSCINAQTAGEEQPTHTARAMEFDLLPA